jgi:hypothetical protein
MVEVSLNEWSMFYAGLSLEDCSITNFNTMSMSISNIIITMYNIIIFPTFLIQDYKKMLAYITNPSVTRNECTEAINSVLDTVSASTDDTVLSRVWDMGYGICCYDLL